MLQLRFGNRQQEKLIKHLKERRWPILGIDWERRRVNQNRNLKLLANYPKDNLPAAASNCIIPFHRVRLNHYLPHLSTIIAGIAQLYFSIVKNICILCLNNCGGSYSTMSFTCYWSNASFYFYSFSRSVKELIQFPIFISYAKFLRAFQTIHSFFKE